MKTNCILHRGILITPVLLMVLSAACSIKPHNQLADQGRNKAIIELSKPGAADPSGKRTRVATSLDKKSSDKKKSISAPKAEKAVASTKTAAKTEAVQAAPVSESFDTSRAANTVVAQAERLESENPMEYRLGSGDVLEVKFFTTPEYNETVTVRPDGFISLQRLGDLDVNNKTVSQVDRLVTRAYGEVLQNPDVTIIVRQFAGQQCYVMGEVERPGMIAVAKGMTLMRAIAAAGGPKKGARMSSIILIRSEDLKVAEASRVDLSFGHLSKHMETDMAVNAYDVIYVPKTFIADVVTFMSQIYDIVLPPFDAWARYEFWYKN